MPWQKRRGLAIATRRAADHERVAGHRRGRLVGGCARHFATDQQCLSEVESRSKAAGLIMPFARSVLPSKQTCEVQLLPLKPARCGPGGDIF
jgi:hypothetical protein